MASLYSVPDLPPSKDTEFWDGDRSTSEPVKIEIKCPNKVSDCENLIQEGNRILCVKCNRGGIVAGYMKVVEGKLVDIRKYLTPSSK